MDPMDSQSDGQVSSPTIDKCEIFKCDKYLNNWLCPSVGRSVGQLGDI